jgi:hypothetical protein
MRLNSISTGQVETNLGLGKEGVVATVGSGDARGAACLAPHANVTDADYVIDGGLVKTT